MLESGGLRMYVLRIQGTVAAVMYGFGHNNQFFFYQHGFDSRYQRSSIGLVLMAWAALLRDYATVGADPSV